MKSIYYALGATLFTSLLSAHADQVPTYLTLADRRPILNFPTYSSADKQRIADQALFLIESNYVHLAQKIAEFHVDPVGTLKTIQKNASSLSDLDLHTQIQAVFSDVRDLHTNYYFPKPFQCYRSVLPFSVAEVQTADGSTVVGVSAVNTTADIVNLAPATKQISTGDILESFSGVDPEIAALDFYEVGAGANANAQKRRAFQVLTARSQTRNLPPKKDSEHLIFKKPDGSHYEIDLPWISVANQACLTPTNPKQATPVDKNRFLQGVNEEQMEFNRFFAKSKLKNNFGALTPTTEPSISYQVLKNQDGQFGLLKLDSFAPTVESIDKSIEIISGLLTNEFQNTKGLIIDLRGNGGGTISYGEQMEQLFTPKSIETENFQMLANQANRAHILATNNSLNYIPLIDQAITAGEPLSGFAKLTSVSSANSLGQSYLKPVIILTDSACFSTCDMFTAGMQDNGIATVIATDGQTGGGGANVITYSDFEKSYPQGVENPYLPLPGGQDMRTAWRRSIRIGKNQGVVLENAGAIADQTVKMTVNDLISPDSELFAKLTQSLNDQYLQSAAENTQVILDTKTRVDFKNGDELSVPMKLSGTSAVEIRTNGNLLSQVSVGAEASTLQSTELKVPSKALISLSDLSHVELIGKINTTSANSEKVWRKMIAVRRIPTNIASLPATVNMTSNSIAPFVSFKNNQEGWNIVQNTMRIGAGPQYQDETHAEASLFTSISPKGTQRLRFTAEVHTEKDYDFFSVSVFADGKETKLLSPVSGDIESKEYDYELSSFAGKKIEIRFTFDSDAGVTAAGPTISNLSVR